MEKGLDLVIIDYLQLMSGGGKRRGDSRQQEISDISRALKVMARDLNVPVIALSQLSRAVENSVRIRSRCFPICVSPERSSRMRIWLCSCTARKYYKPDSEKKGQAELIIAKQRSGPTGTVELAWLAQYTKFGNLERRIRQFLGFKLLKNSKFAKET